MPTNKNMTVISLGGSIMYPSEIDIGYLRDFKKFILAYVKRGQKFIIVAGGGRISRLYQEAAGKISKIGDEDKDWLGIHATRLNAHLLRTIFSSGGGSLPAGRQALGAKEAVNPVVLDKRYKFAKLKYPITIASGWRPGWSTDYIAVALAEDFKVSRVVIAGKPSHVYDKDFTKHKDAKPFKNISWRKYRQLIPRKWVPGFHSPVDPVAAKLAQKNGIRALVVNGRDLKNFSKAIDGGDFIGTTIA